jgi:tRNA-Thr(GGU) m(6)t(6)A37 methyltransferase TsaA
VGSRPRACFEAIGFVEEGLPRPGEGPKVSSKYEVVSTIRVYDEYVEGLRGLEDYSHLVIVYWMHEVRELKLRVRPWGEERYPEVGIFATRFPPRPNPIGVTVVELVSLEPPRLRVRGLDAWTGSPVLDIKPYDYYDIVRRPRTPWWFREKWEEWSTGKRYAELAPWLGPC